jgi:hypothetical protein
MTNRDEILKALQATGMSQAEAEALLELSERMKGTIPPPKPQTVEDAITALSDAIERSKKDGVPLKNPILPRTRAKCAKLLPVKSRVSNLNCCRFEILRVNVSDLR